MKTPNIKTLAELAEKATPGPWKPIAISEGWHGVQPEHSTDGYLAALCSAPEMDNEANAEFIAACNPETILSIAKQQDALVEALRAAGASLKTISLCAGKDEYLDDVQQIRGYANSRYLVTQEALRLAGALEDENES